MPNLVIPKFKRPLKSAINRNTCKQQQHHSSASNTVNDTCACESSSCFVLGLVLVDMKLFGVAFLGMKVRLRVRVTRCWHRPVAVPCPTTFFLSQPP